MYELDISILKKQEAAQEIKKQLITELPNFIKQVESADTIANLREIIHGMIGAFHFTGAVTVKALLPRVQKAVREANHIKQIDHEINLLINELRDLKEYLDKDET